MVVDVPVRNEDGSIKFNVTMDDKQIQSILQFGLNFLVATGMAASYNIDIGELEDGELDDSGPQQGELFN
jgi:hypothetical protein